MNGRQCGVSGVYKGLRVLSAASGCHEIWQIQTADGATTRGRTLLGRWGAALPQPRGWGAILPPGEEAANHNWR